MITRRRFLQFATAASVRLPAPSSTGKPFDSPLMLSPSKEERLAQDRPDQRAGRPRGSEFVFARLRYDSGDWDYNPKVAANVLNSVVEYTNIPVYPEEVVIPPGSEELLAFPFLFMTGHKLVRFTHDERDRLRSFVEHGGLLF